MKKYYFFLFFIFFNFFTFKSFASNIQYQGNILSMRSYYGNSYVEQSGSVSVSSSVTYYNCYRVAFDSITPNALNATLVQSGISAYVESARGSDTFYLATNLSVFKDSSNNLYFSTSSSGTYRGTLWYGYPEFLPLVTGTVPNYYYLDRDLSTTLTLSYDDSGNAILPLWLKFTFDSNFINIPKGTYDILLYLPIIPKFFTSTGGNVVISSDFHAGYFQYINNGNISFLNQGTDTFMFLSGELHRLSNVSDIMVFANFIVPSNVKSFTINNGEFTLGKEYYSTYLVQSTSGDSISNNLQSASGTNSVLDNKNSSLDTVMNDYFNDTDTTIQYANLPDSLFDFDISIFTSLAPTITLFSSCITGFFSALGDFAVPLTLFLVVTLVSVIAGLVHLTRSSSNDSDHNINDS